MKALFLSILMFSGFSLAALDLNPLPNPVDDPLSIGRSNAPVACDQLVARLVAYNSQARQHDQSLTAFLGQVSDKLNAWYDSLSPLENTTQNLTPGTFAPLKDGADKVAQITGMAFDNSDLLAAELNTILASLRTCLAKK